MSAIRWTGVSAARAENVLAQVWRVLEEHGIASPSIAVDGQDDELLDLCLTFAVPEGAALVQHMLLQPLSPSAPSLRPPT
jgi:hypothetical protein